MRALLLHALVAALLAAAGIAAYDRWVLRPTLVVGVVDLSEVYISSPVGEGVARNILDPATHLLFSNKLEDNAPIDELRAQGLSIDDAITELLRRRGHAV